MVDWLSNLTEAGFSLVHLPPYDPVGSAEFERLHASLGNRVSLYLPSNLDVLFARYSNRDLLQKRRAVQFWESYAVQDLPRSNEC